jgi:hypothetical protein
VRGRRHGARDHHRAGLSRRELKLERDALVGRHQPDRSAVTLHHGFDDREPHSGAAVDPDRAASHSRLVVDGIVRKKWNYQGVVMTDDLVMGAIYQNNVCTAVVEALNAGVDLLLVAFDGAQFYRIFACASDASFQGKLDSTTLRDSEARLKPAFPPD